MAEPGGHKPSPGARLLAGLTSAVHEAVTRHREQLVLELSETAASHVEQAWLSRGAEARQLALEAEREIEEISQRAETLIRWIRSDAEHEIGTRRRRLAKSLDADVSGLNAEIDAVLTALEAHRASLDRFFNHLADAREPAEVVAEAKGLPVPPDFEAIREHARATATAARGAPPHAPPIGTQAVDGDQGVDKDVVGVFDRNQVGVRATSPD
jgi:hypothetical protein